ncbi:DUF1553 domain-containing protein [Catalinimonas niigatensis]|uniref:DUF1553 domain-containing protein n=1 Tax=Catalinimonas niigatensis TaxID=1397264 RepID=UPI002666ABB8|nr:DUF1553 domain-containing protein [Catalinimonas niigatensis]WPP48346.1 DUF1553 domain-containing protein [Catalinimonas niigatensis]
MKTREVLKHQTSCLFLAIFLGVSITACDQQAAGTEGVAKKVPKQVDFNLHVKPILSDRCFACHGPDNNKREAELRLDTEEGAFSALKESEGHAFVAGKPEQSVAFQRISSTDPEIMMPPPESNLVLTDYEIEVIEKWIEQGAEWKEHWSFIPPAKHELPEVDQQEWVQNPIDHFVLAKLENEGLQPAPPATKEKLLRRVTFDLTGLPPTVEEIEAFLQDDAPDAYEKVVDRLLASSHFGERMAPVWLDLSRYADSHGYQDDRPRTMWPWRDWVVEAFNENLPYDQFITWQLAGDLLPDATYEQKLATGFNRNHAITQEGGVIEEEYLTEYAADRTNTFSTTFLGLTVECARCHDHKYDPISQKEYFQLYAFFNNVPERGQIDYLNEAPEPAMRVEDAELEAKKTYVDSTILALENRLNQLESQKTPAFKTWLAQNPSPDIDTESDQLAYFKLDIMEAQQFRGDYSDFPGLMNTGLPKKIDLPAHVEGKYGKALQFNGANFLTLDDIADFDHHDHFSLGGWIKHSNAHELRAGLLSRRNGEISRQGYDLTLTKDNKLSLRLIHHADRGDYLDAETVSSIPPQQWTHVFATYDGSGKASGVRLYINGKNQPLKTRHDNLGRKSILNGNEFLIGNWYSRNKAYDTYGFTGGSIDEVRIYHRTLSPLEVQQVAETQPSQQENALYAHYLQKQDQEFYRITRRLDSLRQLDVSIPHVMIMQEREERKPAYLLARGSYDAPTEEVERATPEAVLAFDKKYPRDRLGLAQWLLAPENPLTSRVAVNRFWQMYFGKGIVKTPEDFGNQGELPTHPELLDWLSVEFRESGWDVKALQKLIVMSATYQQSAKVDKEKQQRDSENLLLARGPNTRLTAEMFRDNALAVSGLLYDSLGGKWVKPYQPDDIWKAMANQIGENKYRASKGPGLYRRSLYTYWKRTIPPPTMVMFDAPERTLCTAKRQSTSTPLQSLALLNDPQIVEASRKLAERMLAEGGVSIEEQIAFGFQAVTSRQPKAEELSLLQALYQDKLEYYQQNPEEVEGLLTVGDAPFNQQLEKVQIATLAVVANTLFNLDEAKFRS